MGSAGKTQNEYLNASKKYLVLIFCLTLITVLLRKFTVYSSGIHIVLLLVGLIILGRAGWATAREYRFNLLQIGIFGFILSFGSHWSLLFFHGPGEILNLFVINSIINVVIVTASGYAARRIKKI